MINPLDLRLDLAEAMASYDNKTDEGLLFTILTAFMPNNEFNVEAQLAFVMTMTLAVMPTIKVYDPDWKSKTRWYSERVRYCWKHNKIMRPQLPLDGVQSETEHQALDEACLVLRHCQRILLARATFGCFEQIIDLVTEGYAILPSIHPEETEMLRNWMFDEVIPYCAAGALPPFIYTVNGIKPTAGELKQLLNHE